MFNYTKMMEHPKTMYIKKLLTILITTVILMTTLQGAKPYKGNLAVQGLVPDIYGVSLLDVEKKQNGDFFDFHISLLINTNTNKAYSLAVYFVSPLIQNVFQATIDLKTNTTLKGRKKIADSYIYIKNSTPHESATNKTVNVLVKVPISQYIKNTLQLNALLRELPLRQESVNIAL